MRKIALGLIIGLIGLTLVASAAEATPRWIYAGASDGCSYYIDSYTITFTNAGDLSFYVRMADGRGVDFTDRVVINLENRAYCWPDTYDNRWKRVNPGSIVDRIWAVAYRAKYSY